MPACFDTWALLKNCSVGSPRPPNRFKVRFTFFYCLPRKNKKEKHINSNNMQHENSQSKRALRTALFILLMSVMGMTNAKAQDSHEYVDLGLPSGLLWATCNVGANAPEEYGDYFAWGETQPKDTYNWSNYQYCMGNSNTLTKYCNNASYGYNGYTDDLTTLQPGDDAATAQWGSGWRMPTKDEWQELLDNTTTTWTTQDGVNGRLFTAANGNSLFLPAAGYRGGSNLYDAGSYATTGRVRSSQAIRTTRGSYSSIRVVATRAVSTAARVNLCVLSAMPSPKTTPTLISASRAACCGPPAMWVLMSPRNTATTSPGARRSRRTLTTGVLTSTAWATTTR